MTQIVPLWLRFGQRPGEAGEGDALRVPRRLITAGIAAVLLLAAGLILAAVDAAHQVDRAAIAAEIVRAQRALASLPIRDGRPTSEQIHRLEQDFALAGAHLVSTPEETAGSDVTIPIAGEEGQPLYLAWTPRRLGSEIFAALAPRRIVLSMLLIAIISCIVHWLSRTAHDLDALRRAARELSIRDALTGIANRRYFEEVLRGGPEGKRAGPLALFCFDLDGFKAVNDTMGHAAGDQLLRSIGERLAALAGPGDLVARLGGDEFAIIRRAGLEREELATFARSAIVELCRPHPVGGSEIAVGVSTGIAVSGDDAQTAEDLLFRADTALYEAKAQAGPAFVFAAPETAGLARRKDPAEKDAA